MDLSKNRLDPKLEEEGVWQDIDLETSILVARWMNPVHEAYVRKHAKPLQQAIRMDALSSKAEKEMRIDSIANCILLDWKGMKANGEDQPYSKEEAIRVLSNPELSWFLDMVEAYSRDLSVFKIEEEAAEVVELKKSSSGN